MNELDHYEVVRDLAAGGMGKVHVARHRQLGREVALKVVHAWKADEQTLKRFLLEAEASARLRHPGVVAVHEVGTFKGLPCLVMDLIDGESLQSRLARDGPLESLEAARIAADVADALEHAHSQGILHRDLKPANILINTEGRTLLTDFGLAKVLDGTRGLTRTGQMLGTPAYMPPEQADGDTSAMGPAVDVYGLGATLYAMLTGQAPFSGAAPINVIAQVLSKDPQLPSKLNPEVAPDLESVCLKCLAKDPAGRYPSAAELAADLARFRAGESVLGRPPKRKSRLSPLETRLGVAAVLGLGTFLALGVVLTRARQRSVAPPVPKVPLPKLPKPLESEPLDPAVAKAENELEVLLSQIREGTLAERSACEALGPWIAANSQHPALKRAQEAFDAARQSFCFLRLEPADTVRCAALWGQAAGPLDPKGLRALVGTNGSLELFDLTKPEKEGSWTGRVDGLAASPKGTFLLTSEQGTLLRFRRQDEAPTAFSGLKLGGAGSTRTRPVAVNPGGTLAAAGSWGSVKVVPLAGGKTRSLRSGDPGRCALLAFLNDTHLVSVVSLEKPDSMRIETWDVEAEERLEHLRVAGSLRDLAVSRDGQRVALAFQRMEGVVTLYDSHLQPLFDLVEKDSDLLLGSYMGAVAAVAFSPIDARLHVIAKLKDHVVRQTWALDPPRRLGETIRLRLAAKERGRTFIGEKRSNRVPGGLEVSADGRWALILFKDRAELWGLPD